MMLRHRLAATALFFGLAGPALAQSTDPNFFVINRGSATINEIYVSSSRTSEWGNDRLGSNVLAGGQRLMIRLPTGQCVNDVKVVFANGQSAERRQQNTCNITEMMFP